MHSGVRCALRLQGELVANGQGEHAVLAVLHTGEALLVQLCQTKLIAGIDGDGHLELRNFTATADR